MDLCVSSVMVRRRSPLDEFKEVWMDDKWSCTLGITKWEYKFESPATQKSLLIEFQIGPFYMYLKRFGFSIQLSLYKCYTLGVAKK